MGDYMRIEELYQAFVDNKRVKGKNVSTEFLKRAPFSEGRLISIVLSKEDNGQIICRGNIKVDHNPFGFISYLLEDIFEVTGNSNEVRNR